MTSGAILMMIFGLAITWGGAAVCIYKAFKARNL